MAGIGLMLCKKGNEMHYCHEDTAEWWASQGWTVFALEPQRVAGAEELASSEPHEGTSVAPAVVTAQPASEPITPKKEDNNG